MLNKINKSVFFFVTIIILAVIGAISSMFLESIYLEQASIILIMIALILAIYYYLKN